MAKSDLSIIILNYKAGEHLLRCLESVEIILAEASVKVFVIDNNSSDIYFEKASKTFSKFTFVKNKENLGFGKANNLILNKLTTKYALLLNPDTVLEKGTVGQMIDYMENNPDVGAATAKIVFEDGKPDPTAHRGFPTPWASFLYFLGNDKLYHLTDRDMNTPHEVDAITGAFFFTRKEVIEKVGAFDEDYFMYANFCPG